MEDWTIEGGECVECGIVVTGDWRVNVCCREYIHKECMKTEMCEGCGVRDPLRISRYFYESIRERFPYLMKHQYGLIEWMEGEGTGSYMLAMEMGLGKTMTGIGWWQYVGSERLLVICPKSLIEQWRQELRRVITSEEMCRVRLTNVESLHKQIDWVTEDCMVILDEAHMLKNPKTGRHRMFREMCKGVNNVLMMTGTPIHNVPRDMMGLLNLSDDTRVRVIYHSICPPHVNMNFPELERTVHRLRMSESAMERYEGIEELNGLTRLLRQRQLTNAGNTKSDYLSECIKGYESKEKVVICSEFVSDLERMELPYPTYRITGKTRDRREVLRQFEKDERDHVILMLSLKCGGVGLNIQCANHMIILEPPLVPGVLSQATGRIWRYGQKRKCYLDILMMEDTVDEGIMTMLSEKESGVMRYVVKRELDLKLRPRVLTKKPIVPHESYKNACPMCRGEMCPLKRCETRYECAICMIENEKGMRTKCGHVFCEKCITTATL